MERQSKYDLLRLNYFIKSVRYSRLIFRNDMIFLFLAKTHRRKEPLTTHEFTIHDLRKSYQSPHRYNPSDRLSNQDAWVVTELL